MEDRFQDVLSRVGAKRGRSRLEPYGEFVDELRRQGFTCRDITALLAEKCQFKTRKVLSAGWCEREQEDGGMHPAKFRAK